jgi:hypothetical protein
MGQGGWGSKYYNIQDPLQVLTHLVTEDKQPHPKQKKYYKIEEKIKQQILRVATTKVYSSKASY